MAKKKLDFYSLEPDTVSTSSHNLSILQLTQMHTPTLSNISTIYNELLRQNEEKLFQHKTIHNHFFNNKDIHIFRPPSIKLLGTMYKSFETSILADEIAVIDDMLITFCGSILTIYKYNSMLVFKKIREIRTHALLFLIRTNTLKYDCRQVFYNIVMVLVKQKIERIDILLDGILELFNVDNVDDMYFVDNIVVVVYRNGEKKFFDSGLNQVDCLLEKKERRIEIEHNVVVRERDTWVEVDYECKDYVDVIDTGIIKQSVFVNNYMFILGEESIKILKFYQ